MQDDEVRNIADKITSAINRGVEKWQESNCHEPDCGCISEWIKGELGTVLTSLTAFRDKVRREALEEAAEERADAIEQCAIEAGERSLEGVSSHTILGDMWDRRIAELRALASKELEREG